MAAAGVAFNGIVPELLTNDNYERWSVLVKNYLMGKDLWDVVMDPIDRDNKKWQRKNAKALHAIQLSCGPYAFPEVQNCETAKVAWNQLKLLSSAYNKAVQDIEQSIPDYRIDEEERKEFDELFRVNGNIKQLYEDLKRGDRRAAKSCIDKDPEIPFLQSSSGRTILHIAVMEGHEEIVKNLIDLVSEKQQLLEAQENYGYTALALAATYTDNTRMAECMISNCKSLLTMKSNDDEIPVLLACDNGHKELTCYLYRQTPEDELKKDKYHYALLLLARCIRAEIFDVALALLKRFPSLPLTHIDKDLRPLYVLAQMPAVFPSGSQLKYRWQINFYKILNVEGEIKRIIYALNVAAGGENTFTDQLLQLHWMVVENSIFANRIKELYEKKS